MSVRVHPWSPVSPCGPSCLDHASVPTVARPRQLIRLMWTFAVLVLLLLATPAMTLLGGQAAARVLRRLLGLLLRALGVRLLVRGADELAEAARAGRGALVVTNHISWLDSLAVNAVRPMPSVAKKEIASWPVLGRLVARSGGIFLDRHRLSQLPATVARLTRALRDGAMVNVTPEGTTWCGLASGRFRPATFQAAIDGGVPVRPIALRYRLADGRDTTSAAFLHQESLLTSIRRVASVRGLVLELWVCPEIAPGRAAHRRELAHLAETAIHTTLTAARTLTRTATTPPTRSASGHVTAAAAAR
ncbi:lysophospholipid acyltransferase family protein [Goodfellowiella coeruleoviolacea]|uniref:1-acyl-sn-glycerol-3-phosphate acyltransferases n=1 Tax=Goodfellowiella coeruleoviolacea TaxID=334858 RepID=A0AAE3GB12_9PSEU|nr:lysophospholipid acyltransferase family protein [Goodfellowiella coeruleoviolacea]MCP2164115.1 1-acyl-sn-glycerol-3-phosphate acyltransferases [Goodfellowiella coeruleoviolacea]